jgi:protein-ribulosamine 3-kinase
MWDAIEAAISDALGRRFENASRSPVGGGCINEAWRLESGDDSVFLKLNSADRLSMFEAERLGLDEIAETRTVRVPRPIAIGTAADRAWLAMEFVAFGAGGRESQAELGRQLARLHRVSGERFGWHRDNTIGATPQLNAWGDDWVAFYRERRLGYQLELARKGGRSFHGADALLDGLDAFF